MGKNKYLLKQQITRQVYLDVGLQCGRQQIIDMISLVLRDPTIMGKDTFGKDRLLKVMEGIGQYLDVYQKAWEKNEETDYYRFKLDQELASAYGEELYDSFLKRYEFLSEFDYEKGRWK